MVTEFGGIAYAAEGTWRYATVSTRPKLDVAVLRALITGREES